MTDRADMALPQAWLPADEDARIEALVAARLADRAERAAFAWRLRLVVIESIMMAILVLAAGAVLGVGWARLVRMALLVSATCLGSGMLLIGLTGLSAWAWRRLCQWGRR